MLVGSRIWGGSTADSDYDYILDVKKADKLYQKVTRLTTKVGDVEEQAGDSEGGYENKLYNEYSFKFKDGDKVINIIAYTKPRLSVAKAAAFLMEDLSINIDFHNRNTRHRTCEAVFAHAFDNIQPSYEPSGPRDRGDFIW